ncbi:Cytochrome P450, partial [Dillenia turbinata]
MFITISNNIICTSVLGRNYGGEKPGTRYGDVSQKIVELLTAFCFRDYFPCIHWMDKFTGLVGRLNGTFKELDAFLDQVIKEHESFKSENEQSEKDFVDILLQMRKDSKAGFNLTQEQLKGILVDMLTGGNDTISALLEWVMTELIRHPSIMKKTQEEIRGVIGNKSKIDMDDINQMEYFRCVIKESLRLHPPGPFLIPRQ